MQSTSTSRLPPDVVYCYPVLGTNRQTSTAIHPHRLVGLVDTLPSEMGQKMGDQETERTFNSLGNYKTPAMPTDESLRRWSSKFWRTFRQEEKDPFVASNSLKWASDKRLNQVAPPPACGPLLRDLQATFAHWVADEEPVNWMQLVVLPPCDRNDVVRTWASKHAHAIIEPPQRDAILADKFSPLDLPHKGVLVVPRLEYWFLRHSDGLRHVRGLLNQLVSLDRHCVIGCNSWAWRFLVKSVRADLSLPVGLAPPAFGAARLHLWFSEMAEQKPSSNERFRLSTTGDDVLELDGKGKPKSDYLKRLAAKSFGIPWIAWHLWRSSLRVGANGDKRLADRFPDEQTLWISAFDEFILPSGYVAPSLLVLHALLIHDSLTKTQLESVLPSDVEPELLAGLRAVGFISQIGESYSCNPTAYPTVRRELIDAGFPIDRL